MSVVHVFYGDRAFQNRNQIVQPGFPTGSVGLLSGPGTSYFRNLYLIRDLRAVNTRQLWWTSQTVPQIVIDQDEYATVVTQWDAASDAEQNELFSILDRLVYKYDISEAISGVNTALSTLAPNTYVTNSVGFSETNRLGTVYFDNNTTQSVRVPDWAKFSAHLTIGGVATTYDVVVWTSDASFRAGYPITKVSSVTPPLPYDRLLTDNLLGNGANSFQTANQISQLSLQALAVQIANHDLTGYLAHPVRVYDSVGNIVSVTFLVAYQGQVPDRITIRQAIKTQMLASGVGSVTSWRTRIPEIFVDSRFYLIPQWNNTTTRPNAIVFPSVMNVQLMVSQSKRVLPQIDASFIDAHYEIVSAVYKMLLLTAIPHPLNAGNWSLRANHTTYQAYAPTNHNYNYMTEKDKLFASTLTNVLAIAAGDATDPLYPAITDAGMTYVPFDVETVEYCVMTKESFLNIVG